MKIPELIPRPRVVVYGGEPPASDVPNQLIGDVSDRLARRAEALPAAGLTLRFVVDDVDEATPSLNADESYSIEWIDADVTLRAATQWGAVTGLATLSQVLAQGTSVRRIEDRPAFTWRGIMIDVARRFMPIETLEAVLDGMWLVKLNVLHLHLSDDQGFRFKSIRYPELASADGAYDRAALESLVERAADRGIRVVPELDVPGHVSSWLLAHPEWGVAGTAPAGPVREFGVHRATLNPANEAAMVAVEGLFDELGRVFADEFLHFGGDEVAVGDWTDDPSIANWVEATGIAADGVQARFVERVVASIHRAGRRAIGWDEALDETLDRRTVVEVWRGAKGRDNALKAGFDVVVSAPYYLDLLYPGAAHYLYGPADDFAQADAATRKIDRMRHVVDGLDWIDRVMKYPDLAAGGRRGRVLGGEACLWSELVLPELLPERLWSRLPLVADRFWREAAAPLASMEAASAWAMDYLAETGVARRASPPDELGILGALLEPAKWYRRLLGPAYDQRIAGRDEGESLRTYTVDSTLDELVDRLATESLPSKAMEAAIERGRLPDTNGWRLPAEVLEGHGGDDLLAAGRALAQLADVVDALEASRSVTLSRAEIVACAGPFGELLLPVAYVLARRVG